MATQPECFIDRRDSARGLPNLEAPAYARKNWATLSPANRERAAKYYSKLLKEVSKA